MTERDDGRNGARGGFGNETGDGSESGTKVSRRDFLKRVGGGIVVFVAVGDPSLLSSALAEQQRGYPTDFNAYLRIGEDGRVTVFSGKIEMGQGVMTSLAQMAAEELGVSVESLDMIMGDTDSCPWDAGTWGSLSTRVFGPALRAAAAEAREVLVDLACERLGAPRDAIRVRDGILSVSGDESRTVSFGELAGGRRIERTLGREAVLKSVREFSVMGRPLGRLDAVGKVTGAARYAGDIRLPGMLRARLLRPPAHGATLQTVDTSQADRVPGAVVVNQEGLVAVLHEDPEEAARALGLIQATFDVPEPRVDNESIFDHLLRTAPEGSVQDERGTVEEGERGSSVLFERTYYDGYVAHAPVETHTALARFENGKATLWISTQTPFGDQRSVARALGVEPENVRVITPYVGGGFGGKASSGQAVEAARLARITGRPVQVMWTRAEEFFYDTFRPAAVVKVRSGIDGQGRIRLWDYRVYLAGARGSDQFYDVPNSLVVAHGPRWTAGPGTHPFSTGPWRAPAANTNTFARESQIDIMAAEAGMDPLEFRLRHTTDPRMRGVLESVAEHFGWQPASLPSGRGLGVACGLDAGTYVAHIAQVSVDSRSGEVKVERVACAQDMGIVVNPDGARMQMEGCITMGLGYALAEDVRFKGGEILDRNFDTYSVPRFSWVPEIETVLVQNDELPPQGGGEPAIVCMGAVIANAIFDATGARLFHLPMTPDRVLEAISARRS
jgi:isoquinoline 1-oxidoreductase